MASLLSISNMALAHLGVSKPIGALTEGTAEARACNLFLDDVRKMTLRDFQWPFAIKRKTLTLVESDPNDDWGYSYQYPTDCLYASRIPSGIRNETEETKIVFEIGQDNDTVLIFTDLEDATLEYTVDAKNPGIYPSDFSVALSLHLATYIAPFVTAGDKFKLGERAMQKYQMRIAQAQANAANEERKDIRPESAFIRARD